MRDWIVTRKKLRGLTITKKTWKLRGSEDGALNVNFEDSQNDIGIDGEIIVDDEQVVCEI